MTPLCNILTLQGENKYSKEIEVELRGKADFGILTRRLSNSLSSYPNIFLMIAVVDTTWLWVICVQQKFAWGLIRTVMCCEGESLERKLPMKERTRTKRKQWETCKAGLVQLLSDLCVYETRIAFSHLQRLWRKQKPFLAASWASCLER